MNFFSALLGHWLLTGAKFGYDVNWSGQELPDSPIGSTLLGLWCQWPRNTASRRLPFYEFPWSGQGHDWHL